MDRAFLLTFLKELAASTDGVHAEVGIGGVHPNDETFLQLTSLSNRDEYAIDVPIQHPSGWESDGGEPHIASRVAADGPWARFEQPA